MKRTCISYSQKYAKEKFAEFKDEMKSEVKFVLKKKWRVPLITFLFT